MPAGVVRARLDSTFGPGQWGLRQERDPFYDAQTSECCLDGSLWVRGKFVSRAMGGCRWNPNNKQMTKSDAIEGAKSDCLRRCCKDLGVGRDLWNPSFVRAFLAEHVEPYTGQTWDGKVKTFYRKAGVALFGEALANAGGIFGEFPLGFSPTTKVPDGEHVGEELQSLDDEPLLAISRGAKTVEWKLAAKAMIVQRQRAAAKKAEPKDIEQVLPSEEKAAD